jgi:Asp-tRNA(Asn)/Glu-tRNA(Gln) amidotransferase A subunit family amidase
MTAPERRLRESLPPCQKAARDWFALAKKQGLDVVVDFADSSGTSFGSFAGLSYMSIPMGGTDETGPIGMGIYVDQGREDVMLAIAAGFEAQSKGRHLRWPQGFGPAQP